MITRSDDTGKASSLEAVTLGAVRHKRWGLSVRALLAIVAVGSWTAVAGCDRVDEVLQKAGISKPQTSPSNPNPAPAPAPDTTANPEGPIVLTPGETPPASGETPANSSGAVTPPAPGTEPAPPPEGGNPPATPDTGTTTPATPTEPSPPATPETPATPNPTPPEAGDATPPSTPSPVDQVGDAFKRAGDFVYRAVGKLTAGSGEGAKDETIYAPGIAFPVKDAPTFLNSQVYGVGGMNGPAGSECSTANYSYPWQDNFCEKRPGANRSSYNCPSKAIHQGQDIRAGDATYCSKIKKIAPADRKGIEVVAVEDGVIQYIGAYTVDLRAGGRIYRYLHMNMKALKVEKAQNVKKGQVIGYLSNDFGVDSNGKPVATTLHLHFEVKQNIDGIGWTWVSPYMSLVTAYKAAHPEAALTQ